MVYFASDFRDLQCEVTADPIMNENPYHALVESFPAERNSLLESLRKLGSRDWQERCD